MHQGLKDVVVWPVLIVPESEVWVVATDLVDQVTADETDVVHAGFGKSLHRPVEHPFPVNLGIALG